MSGSKTLASGELVALPDVPTHHHLEPCDCTDVLAYLRVSDVAGREEIESPKIQMNAIVAMSKAKDLRIVKIEGDIGVSGQSFERRYISTALTEIRAGDYRGIAVYDVSRWSRDLEESLQYARLVREAGGALFSAQEPGDPDSPDGMMARMFMMMLADVTGKNIGRNWRGVHENRRQNNLPHGGNPRFGYDYVEKEYLASEPEFSAMGDAYRRYNAGESLRSITRLWNAAGLRSVNGKVWSPTSLGKMLDTGFGAGLIRERSSPGKKPASRLAQYDVWRQGKQKACVDAETWERYRAKREQMADLPPRLRVARHALSGLVFCALCGHRMTAKRIGRNRYLQWLCPSYMYNHPESTFNGISNAYIFDDVVKAWVLGNADPDQNVEEVTRRHLQAQQAIVDLEKLAAERRRIAVRLKNLEDLALDGDISRERYRARKGELERDDRALSLTMAEAKARHRDAGGDLNPAFESLSHHWDDFLPAEHHGALSAVVAGIIVKPGRGDPYARVEIVPRWRGTDFDAWLEDRRRIAAACALAITSQKSRQHSSSVAMPQTVSPPDAVS